MADNDEGPTLKDRLSRFRGFDNQGNETPAPDLNALGL